MIDPDFALDQAAKAILATRARGLGKQQWARRAAAVIDIIRTAEEVAAQQTGQSGAVSGADGATGKPATPQPIDK